MTRALTYHDHTAYVDDEDFEAALRYPWHLMTVPGYEQFIACLGRPDKRNIFLGRYVADRMGLPPGKIRFLDGDPLNCRRSNISLCSIEAAKRGARVRELHDQGLSQLAIASALGVAPSTVWKHLHPEYQVPDTYQPLGRRSRQTPEGIHRHKVGSARPAAVYQLCAGPMRTYQKAGGGTLSECTGRDPVGTARRTADGQWKARVTGGDWSPVFRRFCDATASVLGDSQEAA